MYAEDGRLHTSNTDMISLEGRISLVVKSANTWYENNGIIANPSKPQGMLFGNTENHSHFSRVSKDLGLGLDESLPARLLILYGPSKFWMPNTDWLKIILQLSVQEKSKLVDRAVLLRKTRDKLCDFNVSLEGQPLRRSAFIVRWIRCRRCLT